MRTTGCRLCTYRLTAVALAMQGFAYVGYKTQEAAAAALDQFNHIEFPPSSGQRLKVRPVTYDISKLLR